MARIETYAQDDNLESGDKLIGTDVTGNITKNYALSSILDFIVDESTGNITVNNPDEEDLTQSGNVIKFKDREAVGSQRGYKIIRPGFDWQNIPASYANSIWEIRYEFDLGTAGVTLPSNIFLYFNGGFIKNYAAITGTGVTISVCKPNGFDGSGTLDPSFVFDVCFTQDDKDKLDGIEALATISDLGYTASPTDGTVTNTGGTPSTIPAGSTTNASLMLPVDKTKLDTVSTSATLSDLGYTESPTDGTVTNTGGTDSTLPAGSTTNASLMLPGDKTKLDGVATGAEVNVQSDFNAVSGDALVLNKPKKLITRSVVSPFTYSSLNPITHTEVVPPLYGTINAVCKVANNNWSIGDRIQMSPAAHDYENGAAPNSWGFLFDLTGTSNALHIGPRSMFAFDKLNPNTLIQVLATEWDIEVTLYFLVDS